MMEHIIKHLEVVGSGSAPGTPDAPHFISSFCGLGDSSNKSESFSHITFEEFSPCFEEVVVLGSVHLSFMVLCFIRVLQVKFGKCLSRKEIEKFSYVNNVRYARSLIIVRSVLCFTLAAIPILQLQAHLYSDEIDSFSPTKRTSSFQILSLISGVVAWGFCAAILIFCELSTTISKGFWIYKFMFFFALASNSIKLYMVLHLTRSSDNDFDYGYFFWLFIVQYCLILSLAIVELVYWPRKIDFTDSHIQCENDYQELSDGLEDDLEDSQIDQVKTCPENRVNIFNRLFFVWVGSLISIGYRKPLEQEDLWTLNKAEESKTIHSKFDAIWQKEIQKQNVNRDSGNGSLFRTLRKIWTFDFFTGGVWKILNDGSQFVGPMILKATIKFVDDKDKPMYIGFVYAGIMFSGQIIGAIGEAQYFQKVMRVGLEIRGGLTCAIFKKSMVISQASDDKNNKSSDQDENDKRGNPSSRGTMVNLITSDVQNLQNFCQNGHVLWSSPARILISLILLYQELGPATLVGFGILVIMLPLQKQVVEKAGNLLRKKLSKTDTRLKLENEVISSMDVIKMYGWERSFLANIIQVRNEELSWLKSSSFLRALNSFLIGAVPVFVTVATFGTYIALGNELTADVAFTSLSLFSVLSMPLILLPNVITSLISANVSIKRIEEFLLSRETGDNSQKNDFDSRNKKGIDDLCVSLKGNFSYSPSQEMSNLTDINFSVNKGELIAVIGATGSGKSTLLCAIMGHMFPEISSDGNSKPEMYVDSNRIAYVPQQAWVFNDTLRNNILFGQEFDEERYFRAVYCSCLDEDIKSFKGGDMIELGEKGINLSGGQKQRVSIARALYSDAELVLLDDPLSALDAKVAKKVFDRAVCYMLNTNHSSRLRDQSEVEETRQTVILVTNRMEFVNRAEIDKIAVMSSQGRIKAYDTYEKVKNLHVPEFDSLVHDEALGDEAIEGDTDIETKVQAGVSDLVARTKQGESLDADVDGKLITKEHRAIGGLGLDVILVYIKAMGGYPVFFAILFLYIFSELARNIATLWMGKWTSSGDDASDRAAFFLTIYAVISLLQTLGGLLTQFVLAIGGVNASKVLHETMLERLLKAPMSFYNTTPEGRITNRLSKDQSDVDSRLIMVTSIFVRGMVQFAGSLTIIGISTPYTLATFVPVIFLFFFTQNYFQATSQELKRIDALSLSPIYSLFGSCLDGMDSIRAYDASVNMLTKNYRNVDGSLAANVAYFSCSRWLSIRLEMLGSCLVLAAALFVVAGRNIIDASTAGITLSYAGAITGLLNMIVRLATEAMNSLNSIERVNEYCKIDQENFDQGSDPPSSWPSEGAIRFSNVWASYRPELPPVLKGLTFNVPARSKVGICGRTGAGKSSLFLTLFRIVERMEKGGTIEIDGLDIKNIRLEKLRKALAIIPQVPVLFNGSLRYNLDPFNEHNDQELWNVLERSSLKTAVVSHPDKLDMQVSEGGSNFSVGQRQLICLARALVRGSSIIVLDEATASVDVETDMLIQKTIRSAFSDCTVLAIAHRLQTIIDSDMIVVLDSGVAVETGSPMDLLNIKGGHFDSLVEETGKDSSKMLRELAKRGPGALLSDELLQSKEVEALSKITATQKKRHPLMKLESVTDLETFQFGQVNPQNVSVCGNLERTRDALLSIRIAIRDIGENQWVSELDSQNLSAREWLIELRRLLERLVDATKERENDLYSNSCDIEDEIKRDYQPEFYYLER